MTVIAGGAKPFGAKTVSEWPTGCDSARHPFFVVKKDVVILIHSDNGSEVGMSKLLEFYAERGTDDKGRRITDIWELSDEEFEDVHDFIQWLFPTSTPSSYHRNAPVLTSLEIATFQSDMELRKRLRNSMVQFLRFLGLRMTDTGEVNEAANFDDRYSEVWFYENHNWLRVSRLLESTRILGLVAESQAFFHWLECAYSDGRIGAGDGHSRHESATAIGHWRRSVLAE